MTLQKKTMAAVLGIGAMSLTVGVATLNTPAHSQTVAQQKAELAFERQAGEQAAAAQRSKWNAAVRAHKQRDNVSDQKAELNFERQLAEKASAEQRSKWNQARSQHLDHDADNH